MLFTGVFLAVAATATAVPHKIRSVNGCNVGNSVFCCEENLGQLLAGSGRLDASTAVDLLDYCTEATDLVFNQQQPVGIACKMMAVCYGSAVSFV